MSYLQQFADDLPLETSPPNALPAAPTPSPTRPSPLASSAVEAFCFTPTDRGAAKVTSPEPAAAAVTANKAAWDTKAPPALLGQHQSHAHSTVIMPPAESTDSQVMEEMNQKAGIKPAQVEQQSASWQEAPVLRELKASEKTFAGRGCHTALFAERRRAYLNMMERVTDLPPNWLHLAREYWKHVAHSDAPLPAAAAEWAIRQGLKFAVAGSSVEAGSGAPAEDRDLQEESDAGTELLAEKKEGGKRKRRPSSERLPATSSKAKSKPKGPRGRPRKTCTASKQRRADKTPKASKPRKTLKLSPQGLAAKIRRESTRLKRKSASVVVTSETAPAAEAASLQEDAAES
jgi:hypothetical protein